LRPCVATRFFGGVCVPCVVALHLPRHALSQAAAAPGAKKLWTRIGYRLQHQRRTPERQGLLYQSNIHRKQSSETIPLSKQSHTRMSPTRQPKIQNEHEPEKSSTGGSKNSVGRLNTGSLCANLCQGKLVPRVTVAHLELSSCPPLVSRTSIKWEGLIRIIMMVHSYSEPPAQLLPQKHSRTAKQCV